MGKIFFKIYTYVFLCINSNIINLRQKQWHVLLVLLRQYVKNKKEILILISLHSKMKSNVP